MKAKTYKIASRIKCHLFLPLCVLCVLCVSISGQDWKIVKDGIEYAEVTKEISGLKVSMNLLRLDLTKVRLDVRHAMDAAIGTEKTSSIATRHGAFAAINAGFFRLDKSNYAGDAAGILVIDGKLLSEPTNNRVQLLVNNGPRVTDTYILRSTVTQNLKFGDFLPLQVFGVNRETSKDDLVVYTRDFGATTPAGSDVTEVVIVNSDIAFVQEEGGKTPIPSSGFVISATGLQREILTSVTKPVKVSLIETWNGLPKQFAQNRRTLDIVAGVPQLIKNGRVDITWQEEKSSKSFVETRHPRTAVAKLKDGKFLMITVDGRTESSGGIGLQDLAEYLLSLGAIDAMNLDGGGSTTMFLDGKVVNHPSDKEGERKVSDAILVTPRKK